MARQEIRSEISGTVISISVKQGDHIVKEDTIALVEVMKMEIPVVSPAAGKIVEIRAAEGDVIAENALVAIIEL